MERNKSIDIAKGILISFLLLHHIVDYCIRIYHVDNMVINVLDEVQRPLFHCYFMQAFFIITGFCSSFESTTKTFITKQIKTLFLPNVVFLVLISALHGKFSSIIPSFIEVGGGLWFLTSLFTCKILFFFIHKYIRNNGIILGLLICLSLFGTFLNDANLTSNCWMHRQSLDLLLYLFVGYWLKGKLSNNRWYALSLIYIPTIALLYIIGVRIPHVTADFSTHLNTFIYHLLLASSGSILFLKICSNFHSSLILEHIGRNSLMVYMWQSVIIKNLLDIFHTQYLSASNSSSIVVTITIWITSMVLALAIAWVMDRKYIRMIWGKF